MILILLLSILSIATGAFMSGTFSVPFAKVKGWKWEHYWLLFGFFAYIVFPLLLSFIFCPGFLKVIFSTPGSTLLVIFALGMAYGICNMTFGLSLKYMGLSLGYALSLGLMMLLGTLLPPLLDGRLALMFADSRGIILICGLVVSLVGIVLTAAAGYRKEKSQGEAANGGSTFLIGLGLCLFVGITGSTQALGIESGNPMASEMVSRGVNPLFQTLPVFIILYAGSFVTTLAGCLILCAKNGTMGGFREGAGPVLGRNLLLCALAGGLWFVNYLFYGMGRSGMGDYSFISWGILMSLTILSGSVWGVWRGEWKQADRTSKILMYAGLAVLVAASFLIGISGT